jgi:hypothetical protein
MIQLKDEGLIYCASSLKVIKQKEQLKINKQQQNQLLLWQIHTSSIRQQGRERTDSGKTNLVTQI